MDENKKEQFNRIDELLKDTSAENRIKFNEDEAIDILSEQEDKPAELEEAVVSGIEANPIAEDEHNDEDSSDSVCIIDETSTTLELTDSAEAYQNIADGAPVKKHREKVKFNALQIVFTTDHTIAAQGYSPVFCVQTQSYEDGSASFKGLGYKIQFRFDSSGNLTQKCVPAWKDGPNDIADKQESGASFQ